MAASVKSSTFTHRTVETLPCHYFNFYLHHSNSLTIFQGRIKFITLFLTEKILLSVHVCGGRAKLY